MEITWYGQSCFRLSERGLANVVTDPFPPDVGLAFPRARAHVVTVSRDDSACQYSSGVRGPFRLIDGPGEYEIGGVFITGIVTYADGKKGAARGQVYGTDQRDTAIYASTVDLDEAHKVGLKAVEIALADGGGWMATILRAEGPIYGVRYDKVPLEKVAGSERVFPADWIAESRIDVTDDFVRYARPLIGEDWVSVPLVGGLQRFARLEPFFAEKVCSPYVPQAER